MGSFTYRMPAGIPGAVTRASQAKIEMGLLNTATPFSAYGLPGVYDASTNNFRPVTTGDTKMDAILVRPFPTGSSVDGLGTSTPPTSGPLDLLKSGYINVKVNGATAASKTSGVYIRVANAATGKPIGGFEAAADRSCTAGVITGTGTGTLAATASATAKLGTYTLRLQTTSNTSLVTVIDPDGIRLKDAVVGTAYSAEGLTFTITAAGTMTAGDSFAPVVASNTVLVSNAQFTGPADASGNTEIAFNI